MDRLLADEARAAAAHPEKKTDADLPYSRVGASTPRFKYLLGRRLVREDRYEEARAYLPPPYEAIVQVYAEALRKGTNEKLSKNERAKAWFKAAWIARTDGMELMGTEVGPDAFVEDGNFELPDIAKERQAGSYETTDYIHQTDGGITEKRIKHPLVLKATKQELERLAKTKPQPDVRFHYRFIAAALAMRAAALLPDNADATAELINQAGLWIKDRDDKLGDKYYAVMEKRAPKTTLGRAMIAKHWFVDEQGAWATEEEAALKALHEKLEPK